MQITKKQIDKRAKAIRDLVAKKVSRVRGTLADYRVFAACSIAEDFAAAQQTKLYQKHGVEYCLACEANCDVR